MTSISRQCSFCGWFDSDRKVLKGKLLKLMYPYDFLRWHGRSIDRVHGNAATFLAALNLATPKPPLQTQSILPPGDSDSLLKLTMIIEN
jgi:hypothetical protein